MEKRVKKVDFWVLTIHIIRNTFSLVETGYKVEAVLLLQRGDLTLFEYDRITRNSMNKLFRFYSMFIKWYSVVIRCLFEVY